MRPTELCTPLITIIIIRWRDFIYPIFILTFSLGDEILADIFLITVAVLRFVVLMFAPETGLPFVVVTDSRRFWIVSAPKRKPD